ncbi:gas vesicle protein G [Mycobacterium sp. GA-1285]|uniref:gas vesicle protein GvpG n=1 Tax=Mycobacterium sp. GA-1285 TaxID=1772282 RepID=UPI0007482B1E|nr:gas vesicle protein GvpG [Mycobacterium sp. GA-1285]KUI22926.1 gas vesicle protein G [Mycobacterium sp. GA-1285]
MGLLSSLVMWPLIPVRGVVSLGELIERRVNAELHDPARTRRQLEELEDARQRGEISAEEEREAQEQILATRIGPDVGTTVEEDG